MEDIKLISEIVSDRYTEYVCEHYDIQTKEKIITEIPMIDIGELKDIDWNVGVLLGNSGSGKSTILSHLGELKEPTYLNKSVVSQFEWLSEEEVCDLLHGVGLSSIPKWLQKPWELSNGERARFDIAWQIANAKDGDIILIDEFTSVVNRASAKSLSYSLQRYIRSKNKKVILASCHFDIIEWLTPDWCYNLNKIDEGKCEIERFIYEDDKEYEVYLKINNKDMLSDARAISI